MGRRKFAEQIYAHLTNLEPDWSVRVGLLAAWGAGKTTICKWVVKKAENEGHIPIWFSPWSARTDDELSLKFYLAIKEKLVEEPVSYTQIARTIPKKAKAALIDATLWGGKFIKNPREVTRKLWNKHGEAVEQFDEPEQVAKIGIGLMKAFTRISSKDMEKIRLKLQGKRAIVIIDDLDRVAPALIPRFLMSLRELMDITSSGYALRSKRAYLWVPIRRSASRFYNTIPFYTDGHSMLHLIKLSVGTENLADLAEWQRERLAELRKNGKRPELVHVTRHMPKQADELLAGGSIYWVVKGFVIARQKLLDLRRIEISGVPHCAIVLDHNLVPVRSQPRRAFQGWRYLGAEDAPPDMAAGSGHEDLPEHLRHELRALGLL